MDPDRPLGQRHPTGFDGELRNGEDRLRVVAKHADVWNGQGGADAVLASTKLLDEHCAKVGRDPSAIRRSVQLRFESADTLLARVQTLVRAGFSAPRKQLRNAIANGLDVLPQEAEALLREAGVDPRRRAESLTLQEWGGLCDAAQARGYPKGYEGVTDAGQG